MKKFFLFALIVSVCFCAAAQDVIILTNGDEIEAKVVKITETELEYKRFDNPDGPSYVKSLDKVFMVKYENGFKDVFATSESTLQHQQTVKANKSVMGEHSPLTLRRDGSRIVSNVGVLGIDDMKRLLGTETLNNYLSAKKQYDVGNALITSGMAVGLASVFCYVGTIGTAIDGDGAISSTLFLVGSLIFIPHAIITPIGFVNRGVAAGRISRIAEGYNNYNRGIAMNLSVSPTLFAMGDNIVLGIGLSVCF